MEEKLAEEDASEEDTQRLLEFIRVIGKHTKEIKKFEDWLSALPPKLQKDVSSVKLKAAMSSVPLSFFFCRWQRNGFYWFSFFTFCWCWCGGCATC